MKYLVLVAMLLALSGCEQNSPGQKPSARSTSSEAVTAGEDNDPPKRPVQGKVSRRGLFRMVRSDGVIDSPLTSTGKAISKAVIQPVKSTDRIPLIKGAQMYLQYRLWYFPDRPAYVELRRVLKHPKMTRPDGSISTGSDFMIKRKVRSNQVLAYTGYGFNRDYEMVEGDWVYQIWYKGRKLVEQKFTTYWPDKEEIAALKPILALGNRVIGKMQFPKNADPRFNWPRVSVGGKETEAPTGAPGGKPSESTLKH